MIDGGGPKEGVGKPVERGGSTTSKENVGEAGTEVMTGVGRGGGLLRGRYTITWFRSVVDGVGPGGFATSLGL